MTNNAHVYFMSSHPINIATIKVVSDGKICSPHIAQCTHELATSHLICMLRHHNQDVDFRFGRKPRNGGATNMMSSDKLSTEALRNSAVFGGKK